MKQIWNSKIEKTTRYDSFTGEKREETNYLVVAENRSIAVACCYDVDPEANVSLMAAAPEMLHLVEVLLNVTVNAVDPNDFSDIRKQCRAVLAKARGES